MGDFCVGCTEQVMKYLRPTALLPVLEKTVGVEPVSDTLEVLLYQLGDFAKCDIYRRRQPQAARAYHVEARLALADAIVQLRLLSEKMGWDWWELWEDGEERFRERMKELGKAEKEEKP